jgi:hypothetical protein
MHDFQERKSLNIGFVASTRVDFGPTEEACQRSILNKLELHVGLLKAGGGYKGV